MTENKDIIEEQNEKEPCEMKKPKRQKPNRRQKIRFIAMTGILGAISTVLMMLSFSVPFMPSFIKLDFSELPALVASFSMGPLAGVAVCFIKNLINVTMSTTGGVGELSNFLLGVCLVLPAGLVYKFRKNRLATN